MTQQTTSSNIVVKDKNGNSIHWGVKSIQLCGTINGATILAYAVSTSLCEASSFQTAV